MRQRNILILLTILLVLGIYFYISSRPEPAPEREPQVFVWLIDEDEIQHIEIRLPQEGKSHAFIKDEQEGKFPWYFDDAQRSEIMTDRWGGGITLILSGPEAERVITENATEEELTRYGLTEPKMTVTLILENGDTLDIIVGDETPDGINHYVTISGSNVVALVDFTWYEVLKRLVIDPPYAESAD